MHRLLTVLLVGSASFAQVPAGPLAPPAAGHEAPYRDGFVIVRYEAETDGRGAMESLDPERFQLEEALFPALNVFLYRIVDGSRVPDGLRDLRARPDVRWAQADHLVDLRQTTPNDPFFAEQWCHQQLQDNDMDSPGAWDLTTGSDEFVVAILDGGGEHDHVDLIQNRWENAAEVGGSPGVDDDGNGYVDDFFGWNPDGDNGVIPASSHGTHVGGIVGARGDNLEGVAGVNWEVDLMWVSLSSSGTSLVVKGYDYVYTQKSLFLSSGGAQGANVVATNSSFGIDKADCGSGSFPLWNDMYDLMGTVGILSVAATVNGSVDVDVVGDVPTGCGSDFLIAVTNTTSGDQKNGGAGFGATSIDLGAPGTGIMSTVLNDSYGLKTGTSMASPQVAGAVALLHAGASADFRALYAEDPAAAALELKRMIFDTVDPIPSLQGMTVTGGRLNLCGAVQAAGLFFPVAPGLWVDFDHAGLEMGSFALPFDTLAEAIAASPWGGVITIKGGSSPETPSITKALRIRSWPDPATIGK